MQEKIVAEMTRVCFLWSFHAQGTEPRLFTRSFAALCIRTDHAGSMVQRYREAKYSAFQWDLN